MIMTPRFALVAALLAFAPCGAWAQGDHTYSSQDIAAGNKIYSSQCQLCHGPTGDQITGIDLRRGQFRRSTSDEDLTKVITTGVPGTAMPPFSLQPSEPPRAALCPRAPA